MLSASVGRSTLRKNSDGGSEKPEHEVEDRGAEGDPDRRESDRDERRVRR